MSFFFRCGGASSLLRSSLHKSSPTIQNCVATFVSRAAARPIQASRQIYPSIQHAVLVQSSHYSTVVVQNTGRSRSRRIISVLLLSTTSFVVGGYLALLYAPPILTPLIIGSIVSDSDSLKYEAPDDFAREIDNRIKNSALAQSLRANPDFLESRPMLKLPQEMKQHNLTAGTLSGPGRIVVPPLQFNEKDGKSMVCIFYVGKDLSGHPDLVHGGFLATMMDEGLARCAFQAMPNKIGVTANLNINYRNPTPAGQFLVLKAKTTKLEGRKAWAEGWIECLNVPEGEEPKKLVEASALFIEPKYAKLLKTLYRNVV